MAKPSPDQIPKYYIPYIKIVQEESIIQGLKNGLTSFMELLESLKYDHWNHSYDAGKWTVKEVIQHIIDTERIFNFRALSFARGETKELPGFDQDMYTKNSQCDAKPVELIIDEFNTLRRSTISLYSTFDEHSLAMTGVANGFEVSINLIGWITVGHQLHHQQVIRERYL